MTTDNANSVVWGEFPVRDLDRSIAFFNEVFGFDLQRDDSGPNPMAMFPNDPAKPNTAGHIYPGEPAAPGTGPTIHMNVPDNLEAAAARCEKAGGTVKSDAIAMPFGRFQYVLDPDGNSLGLFEAAKG